jgi:protein tyrosine phosphatase (PTP) superfamily phosphohydrolase (DUF442 family)
MIMPLEAIHNFHPISEQILTAGQPCEDQFAAIQQAGCDVVINLALETSTNAIPHEAQLVAEHGMDYVHIPVIWENPTLSDFQTFLAAMDSYANRRVFVHCALNMRVSAFMYVYQRLRLGTPEAEAQRHLHTIWTPDETWQTWIQQTLTHYAIAASA